LKFACIKKIHYICTLIQISLTMKKLTLFTSLLALSFSFLQAKTVYLEKAESVASKAIGESSAQKGIGVSAVSRLTLVKSASAESNYYVFNEADGKGFVVISGDDVAKPVLGYSDKDSFDENNLPPALVYWLEFLNSEIAYAVQNNFPSNAEWDNFSNFSTAAVVVAPLLSTTWNQYAPYYNFCPEISAQKTLTGCTATAMAQIMKYHKYPLNGTGQSNAYTSEKGADVPAVNFGTTTYEWDNMLDNYGAANTNQQNAVATLMFHCGASIGANYGTDGTSASIFTAAKALVANFGYDSTIIHLYREHYNNNEWEDLLRKQLDLKRPILYEGYNPESGHAFVCDGYNDAGQFHFNWGWGGLYDSYFVTTALNPGTGGAGSGPGTYNEGQTAVFNIIPEQGGKPLPNVVMWPGENMSSATTQIARNTYFSVTTSILSRSMFPFKGYLGVALVDDNDRILAVLGKTYWQLNLNYNGYNSLDISTTVPTTIPAGDYKIKTVAITTEDTIIMRASAGYIDELPLKVIQAVTSVSLNKSAIALGVGGTCQLTETVLPIDATNKAVAWLSNDENVATVEDGLVTATGVGIATVTVKTVDGNFTANCVVTVKSGVSTITLNPVSGILSGENTLTEAVAGSGVELPEVIPCSSEWEFAGWSLSEITVQTGLEDETDVAASLIPAGLYVPESDITLFAVYKKYVNNGEQEKVILFEDFNGVINPAGWSLPSTYYQTAGIDGSVARTFPNVGNSIITPSVTNPSSVSFYVRRTNTVTYSGPITLNVEIQQNGLFDWTTVESYVSPDISTVISTSFQQKTTQFNNLNGAYRIRFYLASAEAGYSSHIIFDDVTVNTTYIDEGNVYLSETGGNCLITSTNETENPKLSVFPNPAEDIVYISGENISSVEIKDLSGRIIKQSNETTISIKELQSGIYLFVIQTESGMITKKIMKK